MSTAAEKRSIGRPADQAKREAILAAAARSFFEKGFAATSIEQVAADAGVSKVTIYNHFGDKQALFAASVDRECATMRSSLELTSLPTGTLRQRLTAIAEAMVAFLTRDEMVQFDRRIAAETERDPTIGEAFLQAGPYRMRKAFAGLLDTMVASGELAIDDTSLAVEQFVSMCKGMGDLERRFGRPVDAELERRRIEGAVDVFCRAYAVEECDRK
ncbi:TetR/AcrR family transcriptional regulator [Qipengyuania sp. GH38]|uniref:TetR/AcrR family transcriptional regulator n=1 Tax=Qipengyuania intermedia TaxID=2867244 RepID=UPI001C888E70|nr:TetR/AcrR family transcriptional regulator [Qipengyuania intermedia]MBX7514300.1 TetR/AcrR family transcriptional regulator [Qipengyuania intermedia]